jgi:hypothetical protein
MKKSLLLLLLLSTPVLGQSKEARLQKDFLRYRAQVIDHTDRHAEIDPDCVLKSVIPTLKNAVILAAHSDDQPRSVTTKAWAFQDQKSRALVIVINSRLEWSFKDALITLLHEALHLTLDENGRPICGPDVKEPDGIPACRLFGRDQFTSQDISDAIRRHLFEP